MKLFEAPKQIAIKNGLGSIPSSDAIYIPIGAKIIATAALEINADVINVKKYNIEITAIA